MDFFRNKIVKGLASKSHEADFDELKLVGRISVVTHKTRSDPVSIGSMMDWLVASTMAPWSMGTAARIWMTVQTAKWMVVLNGEKVTLTKKVNVVSPCIATKELYVKAIQWAKYCPPRIRGALVDASLKWTEVTGSKAEVLNPGQPMEVATVVMHAPCEPETEEEFAMLMLLRKKMLSGSYPNEIVNICEELKQSRKTMVQVALANGAEGEKKADQKAIEGDKKAKKLAIQWYEDPSN